MMRLRTVLIALVLGSTLASAAAIDFVWWRTARRNSATLAAALERQIAEAVQHEWWALVTSAERTYAIAEYLLGAPNAVTSRILALTAPLQPGSVLSALVHIDPAGSGLAALPPSRNERSAKTVEIQGNWTDAGRSAPGWIIVKADPVAALPAVAFVGEIMGGGKLGAFIDLRRFSQLLGGISVGRTGGAFVIDADSRIIAEPAPIVATHMGLARAASQAGLQLSQRPGGNDTEFVRMESGGVPFVVTLASLHFQGWRLAIAIPEAEFLAEVDRTTRQVAIGLALFVALASALAVLIARRSLVAPINALTGDLAHIERFAFDALTHRRSNIVEIDRLSAAIARMAAALSDFCKYIPTDLVRTLIADGVRAEPGGATRDITVLFADIAGFTGLSERLGANVIDLVSRYLDLASRAVEAESGTVDKYIGDSVMALWGAPRSNEEHALHACRGAIGMIAAIRHAGLTADDGLPLRLRIGIHTGSAIVGNIGSPGRLNYTAVGDSVNLASRLEGANKVYGTTILISEATRAAAGDAVITREIDRVAVYGRKGSIAVFELLGLSEAMSWPSWVAEYEKALTLYRSRNFSEALSHLTAFLAHRPDDGPALLLAARCDDYRSAPPPSCWDQVFVLDSK